MNERNRMYYQVHRAVKTGVLIKSDTCERCALVKRLEAHHHMGYESEHWLDVQWLCRRCHKEVHPQVDRLRVGQQLGVASRMTRYTPEDRTAQGLQAWDTRRSRYTSEELAQQAEQSASKRRGQKRTPEQRARMSAAHKNKVPWNKGRRREV